MTTVPQTTVPQTIQEQNDSFRQSPDSTRGRTLITRGIAAMNPQRQQAIIRKVKNYNQFPKGDDPYGEHDFGAFNHDADRLLWKIDYYDTDYQWGSDDPADPAATRRVLTIMLASEY